RSPMTHKNKKKSALRPTLTGSAPKRRQLTPQQRENLSLGRRSPEERKAKNRRAQKRRSAQRVSDAKKLAQRFKSPIWTLPPDPSPVKDPAGRHSNRLATQEEIDGSPEAKSKRKVRIR